jgi:hypothetical protein
MFDLPPLTRRRPRRSTIAVPAALRARADEVIE